MAKITIYGLHAPGEPIRYIGQTVQPLSRRLTCHVSRARNLTDNEDRGRWIRALLAKGKQPETTILERVNVEQADVCERKWIAFYKETGANLFNIKEGGNDPPLMYGEDNPQSVFTESDVIQISERYAQGGITQRELAEEFGASREAICKIVTGQLWPDVDRPITHAGKNGHQVAHYTGGPKKPSSKLTKTDVKEIRCLYNNGGIFMRQLAERYGVSYTCINHVIARRTWANV